MYNYRCDICGAYLDPGEPCDCLDRRREQQEAIEDMLAADKDGQIALNLSLMRKRQYENYIQEEMVNGNII